MNDATFVSIIGFSTVIGSLEWFWVGLAFGAITYVLCNK